MRNGDVQAKKPQGANAMHGSGQSGRTHMKREIHVRQPQGLKGRIVHGRRTGVGNRVAEDPDRPGVSVNRVACHTPPPEAPYLAAGWAVSRRVRSAGRTGAGGLWSTAWAAARRAIGTR